MIRANVGQLLAHILRGQEGQLGAEYASVDGAGAREAPQDAVDDARGHAVASARLVHVLLVRLELEHGKLEEHGPFVRSPLDLVERLAGWELLAGRVQVQVIGTGHHHVLRSPAQDDDGHELDEVLEDLFQVLVLQVSEDVVVLAAQDLEGLALALAQRLVALEGGVEDGKELFGVGRHEGELGEDARLHDLGGLAQVRRVVPDGDALLPAVVDDVQDCLDGDVRVQDAHVRVGHGVQVRCDVGAVDGAVRAHVATAE